MVRLKKYIEWMSRGRRTNRVAYVMKEWDLPNGISIKNLEQPMSFCTIRS